MVTMTRMQYVNYFGRVGAKPPYSYNTYLLKQELSQLINSNTFVRVAGKNYLKMKDCKVKKCSDCGVDLNIDVHHKDGNPNNDSADNLEFLCKDCHDVKARLLACADDARFFKFLRENGDSKITDISEKLSIRLKFIAVKVQWQVITKRVILSKKNGALYCMLNKNHPSNCEWCVPRSNN